MLCGSSTSSVCGSSTSHVCGVKYKSCVWGQVQVVCCVGQVQVMCVGSSTSKDDVTVLSCSEGGSPTDDLTMCGCKLVMLASFSSFMQLTSII